MRKKVLVLLLLIFSYPAFSSINLNPLSQSEFESISKEFSANFAHSVLAPASTLGSIFGFEVGIMAGMTDSESLKSLVSQAGGEDMSMIPHAGITGQLTIPAGVTFEAILLPTLDIDSFDYSYFSGGVRWTFSEMIPMLPLSLAARAFYTQATLGYEQATGTGTSEVDFTDTMMGLTVLVSKNFMVVEPYAGIGWITADAKMDFTGASSIFNFSTSSSESAKFEGTQLLAGVNIKLMLLNIGLEFSQVLDQTKYSAKLAFGF